MRLPSIIRLSLIRSGLNPRCQFNPDLIHPGDVITLPDIIEIEENKPTHPVEPPSAQRPASSTGAICSMTTCKPSEYVDIVSVLDEDHQPQDFYCVDATAQQYLWDEFVQTDVLTDRLRKVQQAAPDSANATEDDIIKDALMRQEWLDDAIYAGAIAKSSDTTKKSETDKQEQTDNVFKGKSIGLNVSTIDLSHYGEMDYHPKAKLVTQQGDWSIDKKSSCPVYSLIFPQIKK